MRIIGGTVKGRKLLYRQGSRSKAALIRPTSARAREAIFNILGDGICGFQVLDLFAGTGAVGLEALSRGVGSVVFVDKHHIALALLKKNIELCGFSDNSSLLKWDLTNGLFCLKRLQLARGFNLIFVDPPYAKNISVTVLRSLADCPRLLADDAIVIAEESGRQTLPKHIGGLQLFDNRCYGEAAFWFYRWQGNNE